MNTRFPHSLQTGMVLLLWGIAFTAPALTNKVLIIGVDGTRCDALAVASTPNLNALKAEGCYSMRAVTHPVTHSAACWSSMFTGVWGDKHGVNDPGNSFAGNRFAVYPSFFKRLEAANSNLNTLCFARWADLTNVVPEADVRLTFSSDASITTETCRRLTNSNPDVFYTILLDVDSAGHSYGWAPTVTNYVKAIETADVRVGQIVSALRSRTTYTNENWLVLVLTDHGEHDNPDLEKSRVTWHIVAGPAAARGVMWPSPSIVDTCATVLTHMGVPIDPAWNLDARPEGLPLPPPGYGTNLIFNPGGEWSSGTNNYTTNRCAAWWFDMSSVTLAAYGANTNFPSGSSPGPDTRGLNFFLGGTTNGSISQRLDLSRLSGDIDFPGVTYHLSGWFGGRSLDADTAELAASFLDASGVVLGTANVGGVTPAERAGVTGLLERSIDGTLPAFTRFVEFVLTNRVVTGMNDASADNLSFVLTPVADPPFQVTAPTLDTKGFHVAVTGLTNRIYILERSEDFLSWETVGPPVRGETGPLFLADTNPPPSHAWYRVQFARER